MNPQKVVRRTSLSAIVFCAVLTIAVVLTMLIGPARAQTTSEERTVSEEDSTPKGEGEISATSSGLATQSLAQGLTKEDLANALVGSGVSVSNVTYKGHTAAAGKFSGGTGILDFSDGIVMGSGHVSNVVGPNVSDSKTGRMYQLGDSDLNTISGKFTHDAAVLEFDFVPDKDKVFFNYVFGSEEYNEYVGSSFNDAFGFIINGTNCAKLSDGHGVAINHINKGSHSDLYRNNDLTDGPASINTELDGLTTTLTCEATVNPSQTNHVKLVIADASDTVLDSDVFLQSGSFSTTPPSNQPPTADAGGPYEVNEGSSVELSATGNDPENGTLSYAWDFDNDGAFDDASTQNATFTHDDGPAAKTVKVQVTDDKGATATDEATVNVKNVAPTISSLISVSQALTGTNVSFKGAATDPSSADTAAGFSWKWAVDGGAYSSGSNPFSTSFSNCGNHSVSATATDKDAGESAPASSGVVATYDAKYLPPLDEGTLNLVQKGRVVPVKISIGCDATPLTGLNPAIQLLKGNQTSGTETASDAIETLSSSAADTTGVMRAIDGGYIYNLQVPSNAAAGDQFTIRVRPFGDSNTAASKYVVLKIRK